MWKPLSLCLGLLAVTPEPVQAQGVETGDRRREVVATHRLAMRHVGARVAIHAVPAAPVAVDAAAAAPRAEVRPLAVRKLHVRR